MKLFGGFFLYFIFNLGFLLVWDRDLCWWFLLLSQIVEVLTMKTMPWRYKGAVDTCFILPKKKGTFRVSCTYPQFSVLNFFDLLVVGWNWLGPVYLSSTIWSGSYSKSLLLLLLYVYCLWLDVYLVFCFTAAIQCLKRKRLYEQQIEQLGNFQLRIHDQVKFCNLIVSIACWYILSPFLLVIEVCELCFYWCATWILQMIMLEGAKATTETVDALRTGAAAMKAMQKAT